MERSLRPAWDEVSVWDMGGPRDDFSSSGSQFYSLNSKRVKGVGGSTLHWNGRMARFYERDFEMNSRYGLASDWPISYDDLKPYYAEGERELGVAGAEDNPFAPPRDEGYPMDAFPASYTDSIFESACEELGITMHSVANARNSEPYDGRSPCVGYGTCSPVCPSGAKYSANVHVEKAEGHGARIIDRAVVQRLEHDDAGETVTGAVYATPDGRTHRQEARQFVLAAGAVENARLLLLSRSDVYPDGLANSSGVVGKYFMEHPNVILQGELDTPTGVNQIGFGTRESYQFYDPEQIPPGSFRIAIRNKAGPKLTELALRQRDIVRTLYDTAQDPGSVLDAETREQYQWSVKWGDELLEDIRDGYGNHFTILAEFEVLPYAENRVTLNEEQSDQFGNPVPDVSWGYGAEHERRTAERAREVLENIVEQLDVGVEWSRTFESWSGVGHGAGTTRMGDDPETSVVDSNLRTHDVENLHIAGASTFVTQGASQPTLTIVALSLRLSEHLDRVVLRS